MKVCLSCVSCVSLRCPLTPGIVSLHTGTVSLHTSTVSLHTDCASTCQAIDAQAEGRNYEQEKTDVSKIFLEMLTIECSKTLKIVTKDD